MTLDLVEMIVQLKYLFVHLIVITMVFVQQIKLVHAMMDILDNIVKNHFALITALVEDFVKKRHKNANAKNHILE